CSEQKYILGGLPSSSSFDILTNPDMWILKELITVNPDLKTPVYIQICNAFIQNIQLGRLRRGARLPGSREVASMLGINRMTMVAAYDELQAQGWIQMIPRKGTFVKEDLPELHPRKIP